MAIAIRADDVLEALEAHARGSAVALRTLPVLVAVDGMTAEVVSVEITARGLTVTLDDLPGGLGRACPECPL